MKPVYSILFALTISLVTSCGQDSEKSHVTKLLMEQIGKDLPFKDVRTAKVEGGVAVIVDGSWCYWIDPNDKIYCVNGTSKSLFHKATGRECEYAPITSGFIEIDKVAK